MCRGQQSELPDHSPSLQQGWGHWSASLGLHVPPPRGGGRRSLPAPLPPFALGVWILGMGCAGGKELSCAI